MSVGARSGNGPFAAESVPGPITGPLPDTATGSAFLGSVIAERSVVVCCGSGGVGKTTTAAVLGREAARRGRRVVVVTIDPARRLADALGLAGGLGPDPVRVTLADERPATTDGPDDSSGSRDAGELWAMMLDPEEMFARVIADHASDPDQVARITANRFAQTIAGSLSGTLEYMATEALYRLHGDERFDLVVVDTPPSRQALDFLDAPGVLIRFLDHRVFRLLMVPTRRGLGVLNTAAQPILRAIGRIVGSDVLADAVTFFQAFAGMEAGFRERARRVDALLHDERTAYVLVASPRFDTVDEAVWFAHQLERHGIPVTAAVINRAHPVIGTGDEVHARRRADEARAADEGRLGDLWGVLADLRAVAAAELAEVAPLGAVTTQMVRVPLLATDVHDAAGLDELGTYLVGEIGA